MKTETLIKPKTKYLADYQPPEFLTPQVEFCFDIFDDHTIVKSKISVTKNSEVAQLYLDAENMEIQSVSINGQLNENWTHENNVLAIKDISNNFTVEITNKILPHENKALEGLYQSGDIFCTQCEPEGFRRITPFVDRSDNPCKFIVKIIADKNKYPVLLSNGNPIESGDLENGRHYVTWQDPFAKPSYLFALVAGNLGKFEDSFTTKSGRKIPLTIWVDKGNEDRCAWAMDSLKRAMKWDEDVFGLEYDLDIFNIVAVEAFNMGAMENKGLNIFNASTVLAKPETATDGNFELVEGVVAHEYFHNWTGNRVTCRDWFQLTLKEGLTVFRDQEFSSDMNSRAVKRIDDVSDLRNRQFAEDAGPNAHPIRPSSYIEINNFYTATVYEKGAEIIRMVHTLIGAKNFRKGMDRYFELFDGQAVTCEDFLKAMSDASQFDFSQFMNWYNQAGTPIISVSGQWNETDQTYSLTVKQECPSQSKEKTTFHLPLAVGLIDKNGQDISLNQDSNGTSSTQILEITKPEETFVFNNISENPIPSINRNFLAPIHLKTNLTKEDEIFLLAHDSDPFNRYEAGQRLAFDHLKDLIAHIQSKQKLKVDTQLIEAFGKVLQDSSIDPSFKAATIAFPPVTRLIDSMKICDFEAAEEARDFLKENFANNYQQDFLHLYQQMQDHGPYQINAEAFGRRRLKNFCLNYLMSLEEEAFFELCWDQFSKTTNMTDEFAALTLFCNSTSPKREQAIKNFYNKWKHESLVMNKWFMAQAISKNKDTLEVVRNLERDPIYDAKNPNKVRSLVGSFAGNFIHFHNNSGSGYEYFAEKIIEIDNFNPQLAGRLSTAFKKYSRLDPQRKTLMKGQLERILDKPDLSKDVFEIISKTLASDS